MPTFLDELFSPCVIKLPTPPPKPSFGHVYWAPTYHAPQSLQYWIPKNVDAKMGSASDFNIRKAREAFQAQTGALFSGTGQYGGISCCSSQDASSYPHRSARSSLSDDSIAGQESRSQPWTGGAQLQRCEQGRLSKFHPTFIERVRALEYPQFLFLPAGGPLDLDSLVRFDELQSVAESNLKATGYTLNDDLIAVLKSQLCFLLAGLAGQEFQDWASELKK